jgi:hypothetical protein
MNTMRRSKKLAVVTLVVLAMVLVVSAPSHARGMGGHGFGGGHHGGGFVHHGFGGHPGFHGGFGFGPIYPYYGYYPPAYGYAVGADPGVMTHDGDSAPGTRRSRGWPAASWEDLAQISAETRR